MAVASFNGLRAAEPCKVRSVRPVNIKHTSFNGLRAAEPCKPQEIELKDNILCKFQWPKSGRALQARVYTRVYFTTEFQWPKSGRALQDCDSRVFFEIGVKSFNGLRAAEPCKIKTRDGYRVQLISFNGLRAAEPCKPTVGASY